MSISASVIARSNKKTWSPEEDVLLITLVEEHGANDWTLIASLLGNKRSKQCRERYHNHLHSDIKKGGWTKEEEARIVELQKLYGNQWAKIAAHFPGRTDNSIKNRYNSMMRSLQHKKEKQARKAALAAAVEQNESPSSTASSCPRNHPLVPKLSLSLAAVPLASEGVSSTSCDLFTSARSLLDLSQFNNALSSYRSTSSFEMLCELLEDSSEDSYCSSSSSSSDEEEGDTDDWCTKYPFSARALGDTEEGNLIAPFSSRIEEEEDALDSEEQLDQFILSPWWEEKDSLFDLASVMQQIEITPRMSCGLSGGSKFLRLPSSSPRGLTLTTSMSPRTTPRSPFLMNMKKQRRFA